MSLLHIQGSLEVHWKLLFIFVPSICLSFPARGIENEDRFAEDEHKKVREAVSWNDQFNDSRIWHNIEGQKALTWASDVDFFQRDCLSWVGKREGRRSKQPAESPTDGQEQFHLQDLMSRKIIV